MRAAFSLAILATVPFLFTARKAHAGGFLDGLKKKGQKVVDDLRGQAELATGAVMDLQRQLRGLQERVVWSALQPSTNRSAVQAAVGRQGSVIWGVELTHSEYWEMAQAIGASLATGEAGPMLVYAKDYMRRTMDAVKSQMRRLGDRAAGQLAQAAEAALWDALRTGSTSRLERQFLGGPPIELYAGVATYNWEKRIGAHIPVIRQGRIVWEYQERTGPLPNTHQPYVVVRFPDLGR